MKIIAKILIIPIILIVFGQENYGQVMSQASVGATIVTPIAISKSLDLSFGNVAVSNSGTVELTPTGTRTSTGGVTFPADIGNVAAATFIVTGGGNYTYSVTLPSGVTTIDDNASHTMTVSGWTSNPGSNGTLEGTSTLYVGATLNVGASQVSGVYNSDTPFDVIVNYN